MAEPMTVGRAERAAGCALLAMLTTLAVAGCGGSGGDPGTTSGGPATASSRAVGTPRSPSPSVTAADGTDAAACADGNCEIAVSKPVTIRFPSPDRPAKLSVTKVGRNEVAYKVILGTGANRGQTGGGASGEGSGCTAVLYSGGSSGSCGPVGEPPDKQADAVVLQLVSGADGTAILRLVSG